MAEVSTRDLAELIGGVPLTDPHALICRKAADRLLEQERELQAVKLTLWAAVRAMGGKVAIPNEFLLDPDRSVLTTYDDPSLPGRVIEANVAKPLAEPVSIPGTPA